LAFEAFEAVEAFGAFEALAALAALAGGTSTIINNILVKSLSLNIY